MPLVAALGLGSQCATPQSNPTLPVEMCRGSLNRRSRGHNLAKLAWSCRCAAHAFPSDPGAPWVIRPFIRGIQTTNCHMVSRAILRSACAA